MRSIKRNKLRKVQKRRLPAENSLRPISKDVRLAATAETIDDLREKLHVNLCKSRFVFPTFDEFINTIPISRHSGRIQDKFSAFQFTAENSGVPWCCTEHFNAALAMARPEYQAALNPVQYNAKAEAFLQNVLRNLQRGPLRKMFVSPGVMNDPVSVQADQLDFQLHCLWYYLQQLAYHHAAQFD